MAYMRLASVFGGGAATGGDSDFLCTLLLALGGVALSYALTIKAGTR